MGKHFNPLPPHGGRLAESIYFDRRKTFQSTPSAWRETSILPGGWKAMNHFNPLPPHGGRRCIIYTEIDTRVYFNPLPPHGGRHLRQYHTRLPECISIHSLRMEGDTTFEISCGVHRWNFNPLPPHGGRRTIGVNAFKDIPISIHSLRMEGDRITNARCCVLRNFNPLPPHGGRHRN